MDERTPTPFTHWLAAGLFALTPLAFNPWAHNRYELQKAALVGIVAGAGFAAWVWRRQCGSRPALARPVLAVLGTWMLSSVCSIEPMVSLLGLGVRAQGLYLAACYAAVFWWLASDGQTPATAKRLFIAIAVGSVPVCALGIYEHLAANPIAGKVTFSGRAASTLGNPVLLGDYLLLALPATLCAAWLSRRWMRVWLWVVAAAQLVCLAFTGTRAAWAALAAVTCAALCIAAWRTKRRWLLVLGLGAPVALVALVIAVNMRWSVGDRLRELPLVQRLSIVSELEAGGGVERVRPAVWRACLRLLRGDTSVPVGAQWMQPLRPLVGFGPETLGIAFWTVFPRSLVADEGRRTQVDRAHSLFLDVALERGLLGVAATVWLWAAFFWLAVRSVRTAAPAARACIFACTAGAAAHLLAAQVGLELTASSVLVYGYFGIAAGLSRARFGEESASAPSPRGRTSAVRVVASALALCGACAMVLLVAADASFGRAFRLRSRGDYAQAGVAAERAVRLEPWHGHYHLLVSQLYLDMAQRVPRVEGSGEFRLELFEHSLAQARAAIDLWPLMVQYYGAAAKACEAAAAMGHRGWGQKALGYWQAGLAICPTRPELWEGLARHYERGRDYDQAIACLDASLKIEPKNADTWCELAQAALAKGDAAKAKDAIATALKHKPGYARALVLRKEIEGSP